MKCTFKNKTKKKTECFKYTENKLIYTIQFSNTTCMLLILQNSELTNFIVNTYAQNTVH